MRKVNAVASGEAAYCGGETCGAGEYQCSAGIRELNRLSDRNRGSERGHSVACKGDRAITCAAGAQRQVIPVVRDDDPIVLKSAAADDEAAAAGYGLEGAIENAAVSRDV